MYIEQVSKNKFRVTLSQTIKGKRKRYTKTFTTTKKKDAVKMAQSWEQEILLKGSSEYTIYSLISAVWGNVIKNKSLNTIDGYNACKKRIFDTMDDVNVNDLSPRFVQNWIDKLSDTYTLSNGTKRKYAPKTIKATYSVLSRCCSVAVLWDILPSNPCHDVIIPQNNGTDFIKEPKTSSGKRYCSVPDFVQQDIADLREYHASEKKRLGVAWNNSKYLIKAEDGSPLSPEAVNKRLTKYIQRIGIEHITYHQLRHTYASIVASEGADLVTLSRLMGHSNKSTTLNIYTHLFKDENDIGQSIANSFDDMFKNIKNSHEKVTE